MGRGMANNPTTAARGISFHVPSKEMGHREPAIFIPTAGGTGGGQVAPTVPKSLCLLHAPKGLVPRAASPLSALEQLIGLESGQGFRPIS